MCQTFQPNECHYHSLLQLKERIIKRIDICNAAILCSPRQFQTTEIFDYRLKVRGDLYNDLQYVDRGIAALKNALRYDTYDAMQVLTDAGVYFNYRNGQIIILPQLTHHA